MVLCWYTLRHMPSPILTVLSISFVLTVIALIYFINLQQKKKNPLEDASDPFKAFDRNFELMSRQINDLTERLDKRMGESSSLMQQSMQSQLGESQRLVREITREITEVKETNKQVISFADQLKNLQDILKNPKQRGILGEYYLETTLKNVLPPKTYQMQYPFPNGTIVDAVVFVKDRVIPIDSKFSLENYNRLTEARDPSEKERLERDFKNDLKARIDETSKYIQPEYNTMDFAFMFIPHEAIYYDLLVNEIGSMKVNTKDLIDYAFTKKVLVVSPTSFLAFLQTVLQGLKALQIEESAKEIQKQVGELGRHMLAYEEYHSKLGKSLSTVINHYGASSKEFKKIDKDVTRITGEALHIEIETLDKPLLE